MTITQLTHLFREEVPKPKKLQGDPYGIDATTEDIIRLIETDPDSLTVDNFSGYLGYCTTGGDDDLRFLFPPILRIWASELYQCDSWFTQCFHEELARTDFIERALSPKLKMAVHTFMVEALSDRIGSEASLKIEGATTSHNWFGFVASFGVFTTAIPDLWAKIWDSEQSGHAVAVLQYLSCLIYEESSPIFAPWTCEKGGGPPELWYFDSSGFEESWKPENANYMTAALSIERIIHWLRRTSILHSGTQIADLSKTFLDEATNNENEVEERVCLLLKALQTPSWTDIVTWDSLRATVKN